jgi:hypothetical protein
MSFTFIVLFNKKLLMNYYGTKLVFESIHYLLLYIHILLAYFISHIKNDSQFIKILLMIKFLFIEQR